MIDMFLLLYPFTAFIFIRGMLRSLAKWSEMAALAKDDGSNGGIRWLVWGLVCAVLTCHAGWLMFEWSTVLPHWWIGPLIGLAMAWVSLKNLSSLWKFEDMKIRMARAESADSSQLENSNATASLSDESN